MENPASQNLLRFTVDRVLPDPNTDTQIVVLKEDRSGEVLPIWVGASEGHAIQVALEGITPPRPMTHDLIRSLADHLRAKISKVVVTDVKNSTYYASIHLVSGETERTVDSRPSDAIALALRTNSPIYVTEEVLKRRGGGNLDAWLEKFESKSFGQFQV